MLLYGASGHGKVVLSTIQSRNMKVRLFFDDDLTKKTFMGLNVVGPYNQDLFPDDKLIISIGNNLTRKKISTKIKHDFFKITHKNSIIDSTVKIGQGTVVFHNAVIQPDSRIGNHVIINTMASIDHDCTIMDYAQVCPNATLCGNVFIDEGTFVGAGATVIEGIKIGKWCTVGAGSVIISDVPDFSVIVGCPGKIIKKIL